LAKRWVAHKISIKDLMSTSYTADGFLNYRGLQINRVRIMGTVVSKFTAEDRKYGFFILDDGTETIRVRSFEDSLDLISKTEIGDIVDVIGRVRKYEDELYVIPEIVKKIEDPNFEILRKAELGLQDKKLPKAEAQQPAAEKSFTQEIVVEVAEETIEMVTPESPKKKIVDLIIRLDKGEGVEVSRLVEESKLESDIVENVLTDLSNEGELFEPRPGKVKLLV
jgi:RPA family protein